MPADLPRPPPPAPPKIPAGMAPPIPAAHPSYSAEPYTAPKGMAPPLAAPPRAAPSFYGAAAAAGMPAVEVPGETKKEKPALLREAAGKRWVDTTLLEWPENDFRIFVGNLGNEVNDTVLMAAFQNYTSFNKAKVARNGYNKKSKGYGFVSFQDPIEGARVLKEMQGAYIGNRPVQLKKSTWDDRQVKDKTGKPIKRLVEEKAKKPDKRARAGASFEAGVGPPVQQAFYTRR